MSFIRQFIWASKFKESCLLKTKILSGYLENRGEEVVGKFYLLFKMYALANRSKGLGVDPD